MGSKEQTYLTCRHCYHVFCIRSSYCTWENGARCYNLVEYDYDFYEAWGYCAVVYGAFLAGISSAQEDDFLRTKLNERYGTNNNIILWTGGSKFEGSWVWDNGEPWGYTAWNSG